jgi:aldehyde dehydrogenase (NAD+)
MNQIAQIFETLEYGPAPESPDPAFAWLDSHGRKFGHFINGAWTKPGKTFASENPANGKALAEVTDGTSADIDKAVKAARAAF